MATEPRRCHHRPVLILIRLVWGAACYCLILAAGAILPFSRVPSWWLLAPAVPAAIAGVLLAQRRTFRERGWYWRDAQRRHLANQPGAMRALSRGVQVAAGVAAVLLLAGLVSGVLVIGPYDTGGQRDGSPGAVTSTATHDRQLRAVASKRTFFAFVGWTCLFTAAVEEGARRREAEAR